MHRRGLTILLASLILLLVTPGEAEACKNSKCVVTVGCAKSVVQGKGAPFVFVAAPAGIVVPLRFSVVVACGDDCGGACVPPLAVVAATTTVNVVPGPPPCPVPPGVPIATQVFNAPGDFAMPICTPQGAFNNYILPIAFPPGVLGLYCINATTTITFSDGSVLTAVGDQVVCIVEEAPGQPGVPRLDLALDTTGFINDMPHCAPGDQVELRYVVTNNDPTESVTVTPTADTTQIARLPGGGDPGAYAISGFSADDFPIVFDPDDQCIPLPDASTFVQDPISAPPIVIPPNSSVTIPVGVRSYPACSNGSCNETTMVVEGSFSGGDPALACGGTSVWVDTSLPFPGGQPPCTPCGFPANDCNDNGVYDSLDIFVNQTSQDDNYNAIPDECEPCAPCVACDPDLVQVSADITVSTTWTADNVYGLVGPIRVHNGATLTIEPGTVIASLPGLGGGLTVARGSKIFANGTQSNPIIMTSAADLATWAFCDSKYGQWREATGEWNGLAILGDAYISNAFEPGNSSTFDAGNSASMPGLIPGGACADCHLYGGGDDDDDSGCLSYVSLRYSGLILGLDNEHDALALGGVGRGTDIHHVEVMNALTDGIGVRGGTVDLKYLSVWNVGDDNVEVGEGWRGKAQFLLLVQGYCADNSQGNGVGDNAFELNGAIDADAQPVTTASIYNATVVGQPVDGDHGTAWRDNARVQFRNCLFTDLGGELVRFDNVGLAPTGGYGFNGTLTWLQTWTTPYTTTSTVNAPPNPALFYTAQFPGAVGNLAEITDSVLFQNLSGSAYTQATTVGVLAAGANNVVEPSSSPLSAISRGSPVLKGGKVMLPVETLDPRPANDALVSVAAAPADTCFFRAAAYRGAFAPNENWLACWTASEAFGFTQLPGGWIDEGCALEGTCGKPELRGIGTTQAPNLQEVSLARARPGALAGLFLDFDSVTGGVPVPFKGGVLKSTFFGPVVVVTDPNGQVNLPLPWQPGLPAGFSVWFQWVIDDPQAVKGFALSNALRGVQS